MSSDSKLLLGLILGAATGAVAGLLLAPASGKETRENLSEKAEELKGDLDKKFNELSKKIQDLDKESLNDFKEKFSDVKSSVKEKYDKLFREGLAVQARWGQPSDIGKIVLAMVKGMLPYSTGEVIMADGGLSIPRL